MKKNMMTAFLLKAYDPSLPNRDDSGDAKQVVVGGTVRARISSGCLTRAIKEYMGDTVDTIRSSHLEDLVEAMLTKMAEDGAISADKIDYYGNILCQPRKKDDKKSGKDAILDCSWNERNSAGAADDKDGAKGRTITVTSPYELWNVINAVIAVPENSKQDAYKAAAEQALRNVRLTADKALFGTMATSGVLGTIDSAIYKGETYSIDEYRPEDDFITASHMTQGIKSEDPFFGTIEDFASRERSIPRADAMTSGWLYSNTMYSKTGIDVTTLKRNLELNPTGGVIPMDENERMSKMKELISDYVEAFAMAVPSGSSKRMVTGAAPGILYLESIKGGNTVYEDFSNVIRVKENKSVMEQGIEQLLAFAKNTAWRRGEINRYVFLDPEKYSKYEKAFEEAGVKVIRNLDELVVAVMAETERLA